MSSPVQMGMSTAEEICLSRSVCVQGIMSSSQAKLYLAETFAKTDARVDPEMPEMICRERNIPAHRLTDLGHVITYQPNALLRDFDAGEHVRHDFEFGWLTPMGAVSTAGNVLHEIDPKVHLKPGKALFAAILEPLAVDRRIVRLRGVGIEPDAVAKLASKQLIGRHVVGLAGQVPQSRFDPADATGLPGVKSKLLNLAKNLIYAAGILADQAVLQHQCVGHAGPIAHLTVSADALIGVDTDDR